MGTTRIQVCTVTPNLCKQQVKPTGVDSVAFILLLHAKNISLHFMKIVSVNETLQGRLLRC